MNYSSLKFEKCTSVKDRLNGKSLTLVTVDLIKIIEIA